MSQKIAKNIIPFAALGLSAEMERAVGQMGFENATEIQSQAIPLIRAGYDVIGRSQTGTGKTVAFGIPALEAVDTEGDRKGNVQVLILCPTRELAVQAGGEIKKLAAYMHGIKVVEVYGGAPMERQIVRLKTANIVVGTPGRMMDHMRRRTLKLDHIKMVILDEADEMLSMGFREDIETILKGTPQNRQTVLFSATMPPAILKLTQEYQQDPQLIEINREQVTVSQIRQSYYDVPMGRKADALNLVLRYYEPQRAIIFCNTKKMVDDISEYLNHAGFSAEALHGDMKQSQRTKVMEMFKRGRTPVLIATDVAARGIDVSDIDFVINYDIPQNSEYYVHRIGRTGRAGKSGEAITICSGRRQVAILMEIGQTVKSRIEHRFLPTSKEMVSAKSARLLSSVREYMDSCVSVDYTELVSQLKKEGYSADKIAASMLEMHFGSLDIEKDAADMLETFNRDFSRSNSPKGHYSKMILSIGRDHRVAPNHLVGAIAERTQLSGKQIGKIEIFDDYSLVSIPDAELEETIKKMAGCKICGIPVLCTAGESPKIRNQGRNVLKGNRSKFSNESHSKDYRHLPKKSHRGKRR